MNEKIIAISMCLFLSNSAMAQRHCSEGSLKKTDALLISSASSDYAGLVLSNPRDGTWFNFNNRNQTKASWPMNNDIGFLALPDENDQIHGINELFGSYTRVNPRLKGLLRDPNDLFTEVTGAYEALRKYDLNEDNQITSRDRVFSKLKVWRDFSRDGIVQSGELQSFSDLHILAIHLPPRGDDTPIQYDPYLNSAQIDWTYTFQDQASKKVKFGVVLNVSFRTNCLPERPIPEGDI